MMVWAFVYFVTLAYFPEDFLIYQCVTNITHQRASEVE